MKKSTWQERREGRQRLVAWLGEIPENQHDGRVEAMSGIAKATFDHLTMENLDAIMIYAAPKGGWHCDLVLKDTPPGVANSFGTRVETPCRTRAEAEEVGRTMLAAIMSHIKSNPVRAEKSKPVFELHGCEFPLLPKLFEMVRERLPSAMEAGGPYGSEMAMIVRLEEVIEQLFPEGFDPDEFNAMDRDRQGLLLAVVHCAALAGIFRYPLRAHGAPKDG